MSKIKEFIEKNNIEFHDGNRNFPAIVIMGYAQHLGLSKEDLETELKEEIENDDRIQDEIDERWGYCERNNYKKYWTSDVAKTQYVF